mgnify:CR=1 FL=1
MSSKDLSKQTPSSQVSGPESPALSPQEITKTADADIGKILQDAAAHLQSGRLSEAEALYRQVLQRQPDHPQTLHVLGLLHYQNGRMQLAVASLEKTIAAKLDFAEA